jgi:GTP-binding protein HflX
VDITHNNFEEHKESVEKILSEINSLDKPTLLVFNKIDNYKSVEIDEDDLVTEKTKIHYSLEEWKRTWMNQLGDNVIFISAINKSNIEELKNLMYEKVREIHITRFPYNNFLYPEIT